MRPVDMLFMESGVRLKEAFNSAKLDAKNLSSAQLQKAAHRVLGDIDPSDYSVMDYPEYMSDKVHTRLTVSNDLEALSDAKRSIELAKTPEGRKAARVEYHNNLAASDVSNKQ